MNHPIASVSLALFTAFAGSAATLHAGTDVHVHIGLGPVITRPLPPPVVVVERPAPPRGYWKTVTVKEWVPGRWVITRSSRGREIRSFEPGYYSYREERVWVNFDRDHNDRGHDGRGWDRDDRR
jgi:hypothetical protein